MRITKIGIPPGGDTNQVLVKSSDTDYDVEWGTGSGTATPPGGLNTQVQFNDGGVFGGDSGFTYNKTTNRLTLGSLVLNDVVDPGVDTDKFLVLTSLGVVSYRNGASVLVDIGGVPTSRTLTINGTSYDLSANRTWSVGTVTSLGITAGTGISVANSPVTGSGSITVTNSAPDQTVVLTQGGTTTITGTYPNFTISSADQYVGTVTSVGLSAPTGFSVANSPVISSGTLALSFASGYSLPTTASQTNWDTAYTNRITSLTTTGSSGAATLISNTLNIPNYTLAGLGGVPTGRTITINGTTQDLSADRTYSVGTVTSVSALTLGTTGTDLSSSVANGTTTPVITLNVPTASATNRGALSSADWSTFNGKENALTFSSPLSRSTNTISIPAATGSVNGYLTSADWTTFNGKQNALNGTGFVKISGTTISYDNSTYYLASNPNGYTSNVGTVTSIATSAPITGGTITGSGTIGITQASGSSDGYLSSGDWTNFNNKQNALTNPVTGTGASGQVAYFNGTTSITSESNLFWDASNDRLGIGTASPSTKLEVQNSTLGADIRVSNTAGGYAQLSISSNASSVATLSFTNSINLSGGNVLINTTTDAGYKLDVNGTGRFSSSVTAGTDVTLNNGTLFVSAGSGTAYSSRLSTVYNYPYIETYLDSYAGTYYEGRLLFRTNSGGGAMSTKLTIANSGNVGIGTTSPSTTLDVNGTGRFSGQLTMAYGGNPRLILNDTDAGSGNVGIMFQENSSDKWSLASVGGNIQLFDEVNATQRLLLTNIGNLGLGVSPSAWISSWKVIQGNSAGAFGVASANNGMYVMSNAYYNTSGNPIYTASSFATMYQQINGGHFWYYTGSGTAGDTISWTTGMQLTANGDLIIGSGADTGESLQVTGDAKISTISNATTDTDRFLVSDSGVIKYRTGAQLLSDIGGLPTTGATISPVSAFEIDNTSTAINLRVQSSAAINLYAESTINSDTNFVATVNKIIDQPGAPASVGATSSINFTVTNNSGTQVSPGYISTELTSFSPSNGDLKLYSLSSGSNISTLNCSSGIVKLPQGQLEFPSTQNASANSNTLDDYEEGNWTPAFGNTGASITYATNGQVGSYTKIGRQVTCYFRLQLATSTMSGNSLTITSLPFTSANVTNQEFNCTISWQSTITTFVNVQGRIAPSSTTLNLYKTTSAATLSTTGMVGTDIGTNSIIFGTLTYFV